MAGRSKEHHEICIIAALHKVELSNNGNGDGGDGSEVHEVVVMMVVMAERQ